MAEINGQGQPVGPVCQIKITLLSDGSLQTQVQGPPNAVMLNGMLELAKQQLAGKLQAEPQPKIAIPPAGLGDALRRMQ